VMKSSGYSYSQPIDAIVKDHPKLSSNDYQSFPEAVKSSSYSYSEPIDAIIKDRPKLSINGYQSVPALGKRATPYQYEVANITVYQNNNLDGGDNLPDDEQIYVDPGHVEKNIHMWFEKKKFKIIKKCNVRCVLDIFPIKECRNCTNIYDGI